MTAATGNYCVFSAMIMNTKYTEHDQYGTEIRAGEDDHKAATHNPFADLKAMMKK